MFGVSFVSILLMVELMKIVFLFVVLFNYDSVLAPLSLLLNVGHKWLVFIKRRKVRKKVDRSCIHKGCCDNRMQGYYKYRVC